MQFTAYEKLLSVKRELRLRKDVYERRVEGGRMSQKQADREIAIFEAIAADYEKLTEKERLI